MKVAARDAERARAAQARQHAAAVRHAETARRAEERAFSAAQRASEADRKRYEKEAKEAHAAAQLAEAEARTTELNAVYDDIDSLLKATLAIDDFVDLESLRQVAQHPGFHEPALTTPLAPPPPIPDPPMPQFAEPPAPSGLFGKKRKHEEAVAAAQAQYAAAQAAWQRDMAAAAAQRSAQASEHAAAEAVRLQQLEIARALYESECAARDAQVARQNSELDALIANLGYGTTEAVEEYVSIVLSNSVYPDHFAVEHDFTFDPATAELRLRCLVPGPASIPTTKAYKYTKATDEISAVALPQKAVKDRYTSAIHQVALRSLHEVFEADRRGLIKSISLEVGTEEIDPATGRRGYIPFVAAGADRDTFMSFDLAAVVPAATLAHLGAALSKGPFDLIAADVTGIRKA